jgi:hypothetical protein
MTSEQRPTGFWQTLPGILTAIGAVLTAVTGLLVALHQIGVLKSRPSQADVAVVRQAGGARIDGRRDSQPVVAGAPAWSQTKAVLTLIDGDPIELDAPTLSNCISVAHDIDLESGAAIEFQSMRRMEIISANPPTAPNARAQVRITLRDDSVLEGNMPANCDIFGYRGEVRFAKFPNQIQRIDFK